MTGIRNVRKLYAIRLFDHLILAYVIERLYWEERGMTVAMVVYAEMIYALTIALLEVPTGIIADKWGRKRLLVLAAVLGCAEFLILLFATEFWHFALVVVLAAIGNSASSGAENALLYESLAEDGQERRFEQALGRLNAIGTGSTMIAALSGSVLAGLYGFELNYWLSAGSMVVAVLLTLSLRETGGRRASEDERPILMRTYLTQSLQFFRRNPGVRFAVFTGMVMGAAINFVDEFWQLYLDRVGVPVLAFGVFSAAIYVLRLPGSLLAYRLGARFRTRPMLLTVVAVQAVGFACMWLFNDAAGIAALFAVSLLAGVVEPLVAGYVQHRADSDMRATIESFQSLGEHIAVSAVGLGFGYFATELDIFGGFGFIAALCGIALLGLSLTARKMDE